MTGVLFPEGITAVPLNSLMKTLPREVPSVLGTLTGSSHCRMNALVSALASFALPYILGTVIDQTITVILVDELQESFDTRLVFYGRSILSLLFIVENIIIKASMHTWTVYIYFRHTSSVLSGVLTS